MKSKTLVAMAVASTFSLSAGAFAGSGHEVGTPFSPNESGQNIVAMQHGSPSMTTVAAPSESRVETIGHALQLSDASDWSASFDQMAEANASDVYLIGFAPMDGWDYYLIDTESGDTLAVLQEYYLVPMDSISLIQDDSLAMSQEDHVAIVLSEAHQFDTAEVG